ncbi:phospholipase DDHD1-like isoform X1 [Pomacea canaliculata]|uniref:phospholipase DDHD1-like isoform X1 n=1 Tax=Pomacea canaliculata TaxID=400727 RepID=UPI000D72F402|nr:phospholipase DDHD1-like isoform X1 [Pomacea canaliculata]
MASVPMVSAKTVSNDSRSDQMYSTLSTDPDAVQSSDDDDSVDVDNSTETPSPTADSPRHRRYLYPKKEFVDKLRPEEIRWFHRSENAKKWAAFIGYDSLRIECRYRALEVDSNGDLDANERILVLGGLYEVDVVKKKCFPVYWSGDVSDIIRGAWFYDCTWQPLEDRYAILIEEDHITHFLGQRLESECTQTTKGHKPVIHNIKFREFHVDWNATNEVYMFSESTSSKFMRSVGKSLGWQKSGTRLHRGYRVEAVMDDKPADITHLVFVIHGIGQKMDSGRIVRCCKDLRGCVVSIERKLFPDLGSSNQRAEFLPVEWRSSLKLDGDTVESITPHKMKGVRNILNSSAMDILYYTSPLYRSEITHSLRAELVRLYHMFCNRHPYFEANGGKVSIVAHSLGSVITYDIITGWDPIRLYDQFLTSVFEGEQVDAQSNNPQVLEELGTTHKRVMELEVLRKHLKEKQAIEESLPFQVENLFCVGSPLAVFLALRGIRPQGTGSHAHLMPTSKCRRLFNIYHPSDPVAYRLEPLVLKHYATIMPLPIHLHSASHHSSYVGMPRKAYAPFQGSADGIAQKTCTEDGQDSSGKEECLENFVTAGTSHKTEAKSDGKVKGFSFAFLKVANSIGFSSPDKLTYEVGRWLADRKSKKDDNEMSAELKMLQSLDHEAQHAQAAIQYPEPKDIDKTELEYRLDYQLRERSMENSYVSLLTSHTSYWTSRDVALFLLVHLFPQLQEEGV